MDCAKSLLSRVSGPAFALCLLMAQASCVDGTGTMRASDLKEHPPATPLVMESVPVPEPSHFPIEALRDNRFQGDVAYLALQRAVSADVQRFAQRVLDDDAIMRPELIEGMRNAGMAPSNAIDTRREEAEVKLSNLTGSQFDRAYMEIAVKSHCGTLRLYKDTAAADPDPNARDLAQKLLPIIDRQMRMARETAARVGVFVG